MGNVGAPKYPELNTRSLLNNIAVLINLVLHVKLERISKKLSKQKLRTELEIVYIGEDFRSFVGASNLLIYFNNNLQRIITTPMSTDEPGHRFSTLKRIKTFLTNSMNEIRLNVLAMMSINKNVVHSIDNFDDKVIERFLTVKDRRLDFAYKK
nr:unnamed protein product [Callosobruchus analis]